MKLIPFSNRKRTRLVAFAIVGLIILLPAINAYTAVNYPHPNDPYFAGNFAVVNSNPAESLTVVSYNIWFGEDVEQALSELMEINSQKELDILLLQEMDEVGTEQIARELKMNYVYYPAAIEPTYDQNFGNAILSRWPIADPQKLILPHKSLSNRMNRIATRATIRFPGGDILVYSLHTESVFTLPQYREEQYTFVLDDIDPDARLVIVGGDFNSFTKAAIDELEDDYIRAGFVRASKGSGSTVTKYGMEMSSDHIFSKGFVVKEAGKLAGATASDHLPIWVTLKPK